MADTVHQLVRAKDVFGKIEDLDSSNDDLAHCGKTLGDMDAIAGLIITQDFV